MPFEDVCQLLSNSDMLAHTETKQTLVPLCLVFMNPCGVHYSCYTFLSNRVDFIPDSCVPHCGPAGRL